MNSETPSSLPDAPLPPDPGVPSSAPAAGAAGVSRKAVIAVAVLALAGVAGSLAVWQKLSNVQQQLARQSADSGSQASEARAAARQAESLAMETAAKLAITEAKLAEVALQRTQLEELMQSLSRSRDENLVVDIESSVRLAQQQTQLTGSIEPLLAALRTADARITRAAQPRMAQLQRAIARDIGRIKGTALADTPSLLIRIDELVAQIDDLPVANIVGPRASELPLAAAPHGKASEPGPRGSPWVWWAGVWSSFRDELRNLVRVRQINAPEAALLTPEQTFFVHENLKLRLLNARLGLLSRQMPAVRADLAVASTDLARYFDATSRRTQQASALLQQIRSQAQVLEIPRIDETLAALATAAAGR